MSLSKLFAPVLVFSQTVSLYYLVCILVGFAWEQLHSIDHFIYWYAFICLALNCIFISTVGRGVLNPSTYEKNLYCLLPPFQILSNCPLYCDLQQGSTNLIFACTDFHARKMVLHARSCKENYIYIKKWWWALIYIV